MPSGYPNTAEIFWQRVDRRGPDECWEWKAQRAKTGYGTIKWGGKRLGAHRVALSLVEGDFANPLNVCHSCDNPPCCNPAHLWRGTHRDNRNDMLKKGRAVFVRGEASGMAKLTAADVVAIRTSGTSNAITARKYGVSKGLIGAVRRRRIWRHVP